MDLDLLEEGSNLSWDERMKRDFLRKSYLLLILKENIFWRLRLRIKWLKEGD